MQEESTIDMLDGDYSVLRTLDPYSDHNCAHNMLVRMLNQNTTKLRQIDNRLLLIRSRFISAPKIKIKPRKSSEIPFAHDLPPIIKNQTRNSIIVSSLTTDKQLKKHRYTSLSKNVRASRVTPLSIYKDTVRALVVHKKPDIAEYMSNNVSVKKCMKRMLVASYIK